MIVGFSLNIPDAAAEDDMAMGNAPAPAVQDDQLLLNQIAGIRGQIARLQAAVQQFPRKPNGPGMATDMVPAAMAPMGDDARSSLQLPRFPGMPHLYHVGSRDYFLDQSKLIGLTAEQKSALVRIKERSLMQMADRQRQINQAERELWTLIASSQPDAAQIGAKLAEIAELRAGQRFDFIRQVGEAARLLLDEQRKRLAGITK